MLPSLDEVNATVVALSEPARPQWIMARAAAILTPYYAKDVPQIVREMEAEDWLEALACYPQWAIDRAARWWKGSDNPDRRKAPLEGDIARRCKREMDGIAAASVLAQMARSGRIRVETPAIDRKPVDRDTAAKIMEEAGFRPKMMPGHGDT